MINNQLFILDFCLPTSLTQLRIQLRWIQLRETRREDDKGSLDFARDDSKADNFRK